MMKIRFVACLIGAVLLLSSFDVQKCADALQKAYEENDYDAFVAAFPDKFENMLEVYGYDYINGKKILYDHYREHFEFLFSNERVMETKVLDKLLSLSYNCIWDADAVNSLIGGAYQLLVCAPHRMTEYFSEKTDEEVTSFLQLSLTTIDSENDYYLKEYNKLIEIYTLYSDRIVKLLKIAFERAKKASEILVVY